MKKIIAMFCAFAIVFSGSLMFVGCNKSSTTISYGSYALNTIEFMGLKGNRSALATYKDSTDSITDSGNENFTYLYDIFLGMNIEFNKDGTGRIFIEDLISKLPSDGDSTVAGLEGMGFVDENGKDVRVKFKYTVVKGQIKFVFIIKAPDPENEGSFVDTEVEDIFGKDYLGSMFLRDNDKKESTAQTAMFGITNKSLVGTIKNGIISLVLNFVSTNDVTKDVYDDNDYEVYIQTNIKITYKKV